MKRRYKKKLLILNSSLFFIALVVFTLWNISLGGEIRRARKERTLLRDYAEKLDILEKTNRKFIKDVLAQAAIGLCFQDLIAEYKREYNREEIQECIHLIVTADEIYGPGGIDAPLILAWLEMESDGNPLAVSYAGAKGLTQLMDFRADEIFTRLGYSNYDKTFVFNPAVNLASGLHHLHELVSYWEEEGIQSRALLLFYALHSYKWGSKNTAELFNNEKRAYRPAFKYVNWILNRREYWRKRLKYWVENPLECQNIEMRRGIYSLNWRTEIVSE